MCSYCMQFLCDSCRVLKLLRSYFRRGFKCNYLARSAKLPEGLYICCMQQLHAKVHLLKYRQAWVTVEADVEGCLREIGDSPGDGNNARLARLEHDILSHVDGEDDGDAAAAAASSQELRRRVVVVLCDSGEVADALVRWMKRRSKSLAALNPTKLHLTSSSRRAHPGE